MSKVEATHETVHSHHFKQMDTKFALLHSNLAREGLGSESTTKSLLKHVKKKERSDSKLLALDVGCGPGAGCRILLDKLDSETWDVYAIDRSDKYFEQLPLGVTPLKLDMKDLHTKFDNESIDLILCEGAAYNMGGVFEACRAWHPLLKSDGLVLCSDLCWCSDKPVAELASKAFWDKEYPRMRNIDSVSESLIHATGGYKVEEIFKSTKEDADNYYLPLLERMNQLQKEGLLSESDNVVRKTVAEQEIWETNAAKTEQEFNYFQFAIRKDVTCAMPNWWRRLPERLDECFQLLGIKESHSSKEPPMRIVDMGCGKGEASAVLSSRGHSILGLDMCQQSLQFAKQLSPNDQFHIFNAQTDEVAPEHTKQYDGMWCSYVLAYFPNPTKFLKKCAQFIKPGGWVIMVEIDGLLSHHAPMSTEAKSLLLQYEQTIWPGQGYDPFMGGKMQKIVQQELNQVYTIVDCITIEDDELAASTTPWHKDVFNSWESRWNRPLKGLMEFLGEEKYNQIKDEFLACLSSSDYSRDTSGNMVKGLVLRRI